MSKASQQQRPAPALLPNGGIAPGPHRIHPAFVIINAAQAVFTILIVGFFSLVGGVSTLIANAEAFLAFALMLVLLVVFALVLGLGILFAYLYYKRFLWEITETDIHIYSGIIFKKQVHIPFKRVQSIDFNAPIVERILGLVKLKIETAGGASNRGVIIPALKLNEAEALRAEVFARKRVSAQQQEASMRRQADALRAARASAPEGALGAPGVPGALGTQGVDAPRFDPQTGQPLVVPQGAPGVPGAPGALGTPGADAPRFDPQTGQPLAAPTAAVAAATAAATIAATAPSVADSFVQGIGDEAGSLRGIYADKFQEDAPVEYEYGLTAKELFLSALSGDQHIVVLMTLAGLVSQASGILNFFDLGGLPDLIEGSVEVLAKQAFNSYVLPVIVFSSVALFLFTLIMGIIATAVTYGGFKARRRGGRIEVERGLLARQYKSVAVTRVQAVEVRQGFIRRFIGYAELKLHTIDSGEAGSNQQEAQAVQTMGLVIHPFVKLNRIPDILAGIAPEFSGRPLESEFKRLPKVALRRALVRRGVFPGLLYALCALSVALPLLLIPEVPASIATTISAAVGSLALLLFILHLIDAVLWYRHAAFVWNPGILMIRQGGYSQTTTIIPRKKIQWAATRQNPFQRLSGVATISATTAAGVGGTTTRLRDLIREDADTFFDWMRFRRRPQP
jgi:putative membrane protein